MTTLTPAATLALMTLSAVVAALLVHWHQRFRVVLPLRRELRELRRQALAWSVQVRAFHEVADTVAEKPLQDESTLGAIVTIAARAVEADCAAVLLLDENTGELVTQPGAYGVPPDDLYRVSLSDEQSSSVRVFRTGRPFISGDAQNDPGVIAHFAKLWKLQSLLVVPVRREGRSIGVLRLGSHKRQYFTAEHADLIGVIAEEAAVLVETAVLNRRLADNTEQLKALNRMKDEFVSTVSHEFKTPLTTILGFVTVMLDGDAGPLSDQQAKFLTTVRTAVRRMNALVTELLDLSKLETGARMELVPLSLAELAREAEERHAPLAAEGKRRLVFEVPESLPKARADARWLPIVVDNLVSNAIKFSKPGGEVVVRAEDRGELLMISVSDDGIGVPEAERERIFERFHRAENGARSGAPGTGLGLAIAREVVTRHGGKIWCEGRAGGGTVFRLVIPAAPRLAEAR
jgi:signal transduction histidine kinase